MINKLTIKSSLKSKTFFLLPFFSVFILSSCGVFKNVGIEKRLYRPGYSIANNSLRAIPAKNIAANEKRATVSNREIFTKRQNREAVTKTIVHLPGLFHTNLNKIKTIVSNKRKTITTTTKNAGIPPIPKAETIFKIKKATSVKSAKLPNDAKTYSLSTIMFIIGAILIFLGIFDLLLTLFPVMLSSIAIALAIAIGAVFVIIWGLLILMFKSWFNGTDDKKP